MWTAKEWCLICVLVNLCIQFGLLMSGWSWLTMPSSRGQNWGPGQVCGSVSYYLYIVKNIHIDIYLRHSFLFLFVLFSYGWNIYSVWPIWRRPDSAFLIPYGIPCFSTPHLERLMVSLCFRLILISLIRYYVLTRLCKRYCELYSWWLETVA